LKEAKLQYHNTGILMSILSNQKESSTWIVMKSFYRAEQRYIEFMVP